MFEGWVEAKYRRAPPRSEVSKRQTYERCPWLRHMVNSAETVHLIHTIEDAEEKAWASARFTEICAEEDRRHAIAHGYAADDADNPAPAPAPEAKRPTLKAVPTPPDVPCTHGAVERILYKHSEALGPVEVAPILDLRVPEKVLRNKVEYVVRRVAQGEEIRSPSKLLMSLLRRVGSTGVAS